MKNVLLVIDTSNIQFCLMKSFNRGQMNYTTYKEMCIGEDVMFTGIAYGRSFNGIEHGFVKTLKMLGFITKFKEAEYRVQSDDTRWVNWDVGLAVDVINAVNTGKIDRVVIGSSSKELIHLIEELQHRSIPVEVFASGIPKTFKDTGIPCKTITEDMLFKKKEEGTSM